MIYNYIISLSADTVCFSKNLFYFSSKKITLCRCTINPELSVNQPYRYSWQKIGFISIDWLIAELWIYWMKSSKNSIHTGLLNIIHRLILSAE